MDSENRTTEDRPIRSEDPSLSDQTNARLTRELQEDAGTDRAQVDPDTPHPERERHATGSPASAAARNLGLLIGIVAIVLGIAVLLAFADSGRGWVVAVALLLDVGGLFLVVRTVLHMAAQKEKPSATLEAKMEEEGVGNPEGAMTDEARAFRNTGGGLGRSAPR
jgi:hypothetical protein